MMTISRYVVFQGYLQLEYTPFYAYRNAISLFSSQLVPTDIVLQMGTRW